MIELHAPIVVVSDGERAYARTRIRGNKSSYHPMDRGESMGTDEDGPVRHILDSLWMGCPADRYHY